MDYDPSLPGIDVMVKSLDWLIEDIIFDFRAQIEGIGSRGKVFESKYRLIYNVVFITYLRVRSWQRCT